jgi:hypothetical protein
MLNALANTAVVYPLHGCETDSCLIMKRRKKKMKTISYFHSLTFILILMMGLSINACAPNASPSSATPTENTFSDLVITLERTACHGTCPVYKLTIEGNGDVIYVGQDFVQVKGKQTASLSPAQIQDLVSAFEQAKIFTLPDYTHEDTTDSPSVITSITLNGKTKTVNHYYGDNSAPQTLFDLESKIDEITNSKQWTGKVMSWYDNEWGFAHQMIQEAVDLSKREIVS